MLRISVTGDGLPSMLEAAEALGTEAKAQRAYRRALNEAGRDVTAPTYRALAKQTGLKIRIARRALRAKKASMTDLSFELRGRGGDIGLKHFGARETRQGVSSAPFGQRMIYAGTFIKGGRFPNRKTLDLGGHVFSRDYGRYGRGKRWGGPIHKVKSGVFIPKEMVKGVTAETFQSIGTRMLREKVERHIRLVTKGVLT